MHFVVISQMLIITTKDIELNLSLNNPECSNGVLFCDVNNENDPLYIQTPKLFFRESGSGLRLMFDNDKKTNSVNTFYGQIRDIEDRVCELLAGKSEEWFPNKVSLEVVRDSLFRSSIKLPKRIGDPLSFIVGVPRLGNGDIDVELFDSNKSKKSYDDMLNEHVKECTFLLTVKELNVTSTQASLVWELVQVLIHKKKKKVKGFGIRIEEPLPPQKIKLGFQPIENNEPKEEIIKESEADEADEADDEVDK